MATDQKLTKEEKVANAQKLLARFKGKGEEWGMLWGTLLATHELRDLGDIYDNVTIAERLDELKAEMFAAYRED